MTDHIHNTAIWKGHFRHVNNQMPDLTMCREIYNAKAPIDAECKSKYFYISINIYISMSRVRRHCVLSKCVCWHVHTYAQKIPRNMSE